MAKFEFIWKDISLLYNLQPRPFDSARVNAVIRSYTWSLGSSLFIFSAGMLINPEQILFTDFKLKPM